LLIWSSFFLLMFATNLSMAFMIAILIGAFIFGPLLRVRHPARHRHADDRRAARCVKMKRPVRFRERGVFTARHSGLVASQTPEPCG
jgi:hypothetical protein